MYDLHVRAARRIVVDLDLSAEVDDPRHAGCRGAPASRRESANRRCRHGSPSRNGYARRSRSEGRRGPGRSGSRPRRGPGLPLRGREHGLTPLSVVELAPVIATRTSSPAAARPVKLTVVLRRVRPRLSVESVRLGPSTSTCSTPPIRSALRVAATRWTTSISRSIRSRLTSVRHLIGHGRGFRPAARREDERERAVEADLLDRLQRLRRSRPRSRRGSRRSGRWSARDRGSPRACPRRAS